MSDAFGKSVVSKKQASSRSGKIGFAFGGLAGFNAHNAGVLQAMLDTGLEADVITCTSGAIWWVAQYLQRKNLQELMKEQANAMKGVSGLTLPFTGLPGVFRPAIEHYFARFWEPLPAAAMSFFVNSFKVPELYEFLQSPPITEWLNRLLPAESYVPTRPEKEFDEILKSFQAESAPAILFNAYDVQNGWEVVYCNQKAYDLLRIDTVGARGADGPARPFRN